MAVAQTTTTSRRDPINPVFLKKLLLELSDEDADLQLKFVVHSAPSQDKLDDSNILGYSLVGVADLMDSLEKERPFLLENFASQSAQRLLADNQ